MTKDSGIPEGWRKSTPLPQEPEIEWVSIEKLLDEYTIPVLAEAIDSLDIQTFDITGRRILATDGDETEHYSKAFALKHLALRHSMLQDPEPDDDLFYETLEVQGSPLDKFGWLKQDLPDLDTIEPHHQSRIQIIPSPSDTAGWVTQARTIAKTYISRHTETDLHPNLDDTSNHVAEQMRTQMVYGPQGTPLSASYIKRHALQGEWWRQRNML
ncbi:hypothetical protein G6677_00190 [Polynucleobacter paneuropaeus]|nr:hypothetical protein [Polynucleobacter paneuropaeus]